MAAVEHKVADHKLTIVEVVDWLLADGLLTAADAELVKKERRYYRGSQHALQVIAEQKLKNAKPPHKPLGLDTLSEWLAGRVGMEYRHIDPLKVNFSAVTEVMSS